VAFGYPAYMNRSCRASHECEAETIRRADDVVVTIITTAGEDDRTYLTRGGWLDRTFPNSKMPVKTLQKARAPRTRRRITNRRMSRAHRLPEPENPRLRKYVFP
jgi:hypothetical protein